jgi:signal transduction histidine kinase
MAEPSDNGGQQNPLGLPAVLVIDDERGPRESLRILLKPEFHVYCAESVDAGVALLKAHRPELVILDIRMPGTSGIEGLRQIRELDQTVAVVMFTGYGALETAQEAIRLGANEYLKKPLDVFEVTNIVRRHVHRTQAARRRLTAESELASLNETLRAELARHRHFAELGRKSAELVHDLRNPLAAVLGYLELLGDQLRATEGDPGQRQPEVEEFLDGILQGVIRCRDLTEMWLALSRGTLRLVPVDLGEVARRMARECRPLAETKRVSVTVRAGPPLVLQGDDVQLGRAVQNLIRNAIEAVAPGTGTVTVDGGEQDGGLRLCVEDNGAGMTEEQIASAGTAFMTGKRREGGTGLGLFIARQVAEAHGGVLKFRSVPGRGTVASLEFPRPPS